MRSINILAVYHQSHSSSVCQTQTRHYLKENKKIDKQQYCLQLTKYICFTQEYKQKPLNLFMLHFMWNVT